MPGRRGGPWRLPGRGRGDGGARITPRPRLVWPAALHPLRPPVLSRDDATRWLSFTHLIGIHPNEVAQGLKRAQDPEWVAHISRFLELESRAGQPCSGAIIARSTYRRGARMEPPEVAAVIMLVWQANGQRFGDGAVRAPWAGLADALKAPAQASPPTPRPGWLVLALSPDDGRARLTLQWLGKRDGARLKLRKLPPGRIDEVLVDPQPAEREAWWVARLADPERVAAYRADLQAAEGAVQALMRLAPDLQEVQLGGRPVQASRDPWRPTLELRDAADGTLQVGLGPRPAWISDFAPRWVVVDGTLRPLARGAWPLQRLLWDAPWRVAPSLIPSLVDDLLTRVDLPLAVGSAHLSLAVGGPTPRLQIVDEGDGQIRVGVAWRYGAVDLTAEHGAVLRAEGGLLARDGAAEAALTADAVRAVAQARPGVTALPARLSGDATWAFLRDLPQRLAGWTVEADRDLVRRLRGPIRPRVQLSDATDWFDLDVGFRLDDADVALRHVLAAWRAQRQFITLKGGQVAELPTAWLDQHGDTVEALADLRRAGKQRLGAPAAHVARDLLAQAAPEQAAAAHRWLAVADRLRAFDAVPERAPPKALQATLRPYQRGGYRWLAFLRGLGLGGVLADDMGLGKTVQTLALLLDGRATAAHPDLVVAPTSVIHNWGLEAQRFAPSLRVHLHHGPKRGQPPRDVDLVVTSYALLRRDRADALAGPWHTAVLDEAQHIKNPASAVSKAAHALDARHRVALTGTPLENHLLELWSILGFVAPGLFGSRQAFAERYVRPMAMGDELGQRRLVELRRRMRPFLLRRLKREVATELPPRQEQVLTVELGPKQARLYGHLRDAYRAEVLATVEARGLAKSKIKVLEALLRLRQAACEPSLLPAALGKGLDESAKRAALAELLPTLADEGHRSLVFSQWPGFLKRVAQDLDAWGLPYLYLDGSTRDRAPLQARWNAPDGPPFFLISIKAGGTGLNLVAADHVIHLDPWWNPAVEQQATDRAHRIGQTKPVLVYKLVARGTVEEKVIELQARKRDLFDQTVDADRVAVEQLTAADLQAVFGTVTALPGAKRKAGPPDGPDDGLSRLVAGGQPITNARVRDALALDRRGAQQQLKAWVAAGRLRREGHGRGTHYLPI